MYRDADAEHEGERECHYIFFVDSLAGFNDLGCTDRSDGALELVTRP